MYASLSSSSSFFVSSRTQHRERPTPLFISFPFLLFFSFTLLSSRRTQIVFFLHIQIFFSSSSLSLSCSCFVFTEKPRCIFFLFSSSFSLTVVLCSQRNLDRSLTFKKQNTDALRKEKEIGAVSLEDSSLLGFFSFQVVLSGAGRGGYPLPKYFQTRNPPRTGQ
jgi:hypothetical protein